MNARAGVCYWYDQKPVDGKQEILVPVRRMTKKQRMDLLMQAAIEIIREMVELSGRPRNAGRR